jgi:hypothetical protein
MWHWVRRRGDHTKKQLSACWCGEEICGDYWLESTHDNEVDEKGKYVAAVGLFGVVIIGKCVARYWEVEDAWA